MTTMTKTAVKAVNSQIRTLQRERHRVLSGRDLPWGIPWCRGPGNPFHQEPLCEGCGIVAMARDEAAVIAGRICELEASLVPVAQGVLW